ncbi:class I SAM-dependent methyltransferase [Patulibacter defluvii]|uniref:class I SAM-dependent methyltransferase n=1 Tax=Patulibacter defluvii TaxID=3095358 RepID=UPI002A75A13D|nr:class I SAM-dependent methyltransferase [Patulibacter sp. DM4]
MPAAETRYVQRNQPPGVPPLELTGERTLPDVPEENYWYRRHLVVYEWIAERLAQRPGPQRVVDLACGEGYGSAVLARTAAEVVGVDANPEAHEHARLRYVRPNLRFERTLVETYDAPTDVVVFLQTIEHVQDPDAILERFKQLIGPAGEAYVSTPNLLTLAPDGAEKSENPWHIKEYRADEYRELLERHFSRVEIHGLFHHRKLALHQFAIERLGWDRLHKALRITKPFYGWFTPAIAASDFVLRTAADGADLDKALDFVAVVRP